MKRALSLILALVLLIGLVPVNVFSAGVDDTPALDSIAWENLTYRDIFVTNNKAYLNGFDNLTFSPYVQNTGKNAITPDACNTEPYSIAAFGSSSQQIKSVSQLPAGDYFVASKVYCTRYTAGKLGICLYDTTVGVAGVTDGFVTAAAILSRSAPGQIFIGSIHSANLDGYVDDTVVVNMSIFSNRPGEAELTALYEQYVQIEKAANRENLPTTDTLDSIAWENLTYRDIFITNNKAYLNGFDNRTFSPYVQNAGTNTITADVCHTEPYSLAAIGSSSQQIKSVSDLPAGNYFVASKVYCTRYTAGKLGICLYDTTVGVAGVTDGFVTAAAILSRSAPGQIFIGSIHSANLDGYVDDTVVVNMSIFSNRPSEAELTALYEQYVQIEKAAEKEKVPFTEQEMLDAFVACMNEKAASIGMTDSSFNDPVGIDNTTTAADLLRLMVYAYTNYDELNGIWNQTSHTVTVGGEKARNQTVVSTVMKPALTEHYQILGGKTGTLTNYNARNMAVILEIPESRDRLAVVALYAYGSDTDANNRFEAVRQAADAALKKYADPNWDNTSADVCCAGAIACLIPADGVDMDDLQILYEKDCKTRRVPASITKVLAAICALDIMDDLTQTVAYTDFDTQIGGFYAKDFYPGDNINVEDALYAMMLPSSNVTARMVARSAGKMILEAENSHVHNYHSEITAPTCTEQGYTTCTCSCGESYVTDEVEATGHEYENGSCVNCGGKQPVGPVIVLQPVNTTVYLNEFAEVTVEAEGTGLTYQWYYKDTTHNRYYRSTITEPTYRLKMTGDRNGRLLYCVITDAKGRQVTSDVVTLTASPREELEIVSQPETVTGILNQFVSVELNVTGDDLTYQWFYKDTNLGRFYTSTITDPAYKVKMLPERDGRQVYCIITDGLGNQVKSGITTLKAKNSVALNIVTQPTDVEGALNSFVTVSMKVEGDGLTYQWYYKDTNHSTFYKSTITDAEYRVKMLPERNGRQVYCEITDALGNMVRTETVTMTAYCTTPLKIISRPTDVKGDLNSFVTVSMEVQGEGLTYQWYFKDPNHSTFYKSSITDAEYRVKMLAERNGRQVYCVITDALGHQVTTETVTLSQANHITAYYPTLSDALAGTSGSQNMEGAAVKVVKNNGNTTVTMLQNAELTETLVIQSGLTLCLNGYTVTSSAFPAISIAADVVIDGTADGSALLVSGDDAVCAVSVESGSCTINGGNYHSTSVNAAVTVIQAAAGTAMSVNNASVKALDTANGVVVGIKTEAGSTLTASGCKILVTTERSLNNRGVYANGSAVLTDCSVIAESDYTGANGEYTSNSVGIFSTGDLELNNCTVWGTVAGVVAKGNVTVDGGTYSGYGHGAFYLSGEGTTSYFYNATLKWAKMRSGTVADSVAGTNNSAFYIGMANYVTAYFDGCTFQSSNATKSYCITLRNSGGEHDNTVYVSNSSFSKYKKYAYRSNGVSVETNLTAYSGIGNSYSAGVFQYSRNGVYTQDSYARP